MPKFVAFIRGVGTGNPHLKNDNLRDVFEYLGFTNVKTVLTSGNVIFEYWMKSRSALEWHIERIITEKLSVKTTAIVKSKGELRDLLDKGFFHGNTDSPSSRFNITLVKNLKKANLKAFENLQGESYKILGAYKGAIYSLVDQTKKATPKFMSYIEKSLGKDITTRTVDTLKKILAKFP